MIAELTKKDPEYDFVADDGVQHRFWVLDNQEIVKSIIGEFETMPATYVADGHHRTAAAALVGNELKLENDKHTGDEEYNFFWQCIFLTASLKSLTTIVWCRI